MTALRPLFAYAGGKRRLAKHILPLIPPHTCWCEPFCGALGLFLAKPRSTVEVLNDANQQLISLFRCVKFHAPELERELAWIPNSRQDFADFLSQPGLTEIQRAARLLFRLRLCFGGNSSSFGIVKTAGGGAANSLALLRGGLARLAERLDRVLIENRDWAEIVRLYDAPGTLFFFDPPYLGCDNPGYAAFTPEQMQALADTLPGLQDQWILTADAGPSREIFARWPMRVVERVKGNHNAKGAARTYAEIIVSPLLKTEN